MSGMGSYDDGGFSCFTMRVGGGSDIGDKITAVCFGDDVLLVSIDNNLPA